MYEELTHDAMLDEAIVPSRVLERGDVPLSFNQAALVTLEWFKGQRRPADRGANVLPLVFEVEGRIDVPALERALDGIIARHDVLRTAFPDPRRLSRADERMLTDCLRRRDLAGVTRLRSQVREDARLALEVVQHEVQGDGAPAALAERIGSIVARPFAYDAPPLMRAALIRVSATSHVLILVLHHLVADRWSLRILRTELDAFYAASATGRAPQGLPELPIQYGHYAAWHVDRFSVPGAGDVYWRDRWAEYGHALLRARDLPFADPGCAGVGSGFDCVLLPAATLAAIRVAAGRMGATLYMLGLAALAILMHARTGRLAVAVWGYCANRGHCGTEHLIGWFTNGRILGLTLRPDAAVADVVMAARDAASDAHRHQHIPVQLLARAAGAGGFEAGSDDYVSFDTVTVRVPRLPPLPDGVVIRYAPETLTANATRRETGRRSFELCVVDERSQLRVTCRYARDTFPPESIRRLLEDYVTVFLALCQNPTQRVAEVIARVGQTRRP
jgi:hypothetical protein